jgi:hypothetical protein
MPRVCSGTGHGRIALAELIHGTAQGEIFFRKNFFFNLTSEIEFAKNLTSEIEFVLKGGQRKNNQKPVSAISRNLLDFKTS